jgi:hypothetical protein
MTIDWERVNEDVSSVIDSETLRKKPIHEQNDRREIVDQIIEAFNQSGYE